MLDSQSITLLSNALKGLRGGQPLAVEPEPKSGWLGIEHLGFVSLKPSRERAVVEGVARLWGTETIMMAAQTTAGCGAYARYVDGELTRFLSAGNGVWFEASGQSEAWESVILKDESPLTMVRGAETRFDDLAVFQLWKHLGFQGPND